MLSETLRSRWFAGCVHAALWLLLLLIITGVGGKRPLFSEATPNPAAVIAPVPVAKMDGLFAYVPQTNSPATGLDPFITSHFMPKTPPPPPKPTTRKIELTYQGFYQTGNEPQCALIRFDGALVGIPVGRSVATNLIVASVTATNLMLTNSAIVGQSNVLVLNTKKEIEIPIP